MAKKKIIRKSNRTLNIFADGGNTQFAEAFSKENIGNTLGGLGSGITSLVNIGMNNAKIADTSALEDNINTMKSSQVDANTNASLLEEWGNYSPIENVNWKDIRGGSAGGRALNTIGGMATTAQAGAQMGGPVGAIIGGVAGLASGIGGIFAGNKRAKRKAKELNKQIDIANATQISKLNNRAEALDTQNDLMALAGLYAEGGKIYIKPSKRGTFTAAAKRHGKGVQEFARQVLANKENYSPAMIKKANFARNFGGRKKANGGYLFEEGGNLFASIPNLGQHGGIFSNGVTIIGNGGTHESNPMEGVPMGIAPDGNPNLVEEGEVIFNDYVFSNRLTADKTLLKSYNLPESYDNHSFADIAERINRESSERPNDPISKRGLFSLMTRLQQAQEEVKMKEDNRKYAKGGHLHAVGGYNVGPDGIAPWLKDDNYFTFDTPTRTTPTLPSLFRNDTPEDRLYQTWKRDGALPSFSLPEIEKPYTLLNEGERYLLNNRVGNNAERVNPTTPQTNSFLTNLRYAPVIGSGLGIISDIAGWTNKPDYRDADLVGSVADNLTSVGFTPIGNYLTYRPLDRNYYLNKLGAQAGATRRAIVNQSGGNRAAAIAGLLAADYNAQGQVGNLARQAEEYNAAQRERVEAFNRGTNQFNTQTALQADLANQAQDRLRLQARTTQAQMRTHADAMASAGRAANISNFLDSLGEIGREEFGRNMLISNPALYYSIDRNGKISYKNGYDELSEVEKEEVRKNAERAAKKQTRRSVKSKGGYLTIGRK